MKQKKNRRLLGYADGDYFGTCKYCKESMISDKRAIMCLDCAISKAQELIESQHRKLAQFENDRFHSLYIPDDATEEEYFNEEQE